MRYCANMPVGMAGSVGEGSPGMCSEMREASGGGLKGFAGLPVSSRAASWRRRGLFCAQSVFQAAFSRSGQAGFGGGPSFGSSSRLKAKVG